MKKKILLPFDLPFDLSITQYKGNSISHAALRAIDFAPLGLNPKNKFDFIKYNVGYLQMLTHMRFGELRINAAYSCWHYHYDRIEGVNRAGSEVFAYNAKTEKCEQVYGTTIYHINLAKYGSSNELNAMMKSLSEIFFQLQASDLFKKEFYQSISDLISQNINTPAYIHFDTDLISESELAWFLEGFSDTDQINVVERILPGSSAGQKEFFEDIKGILTLVAILGGVNFGLNLLESAGRIGQKK